MLSGTKHMSVTVRSSDGQTKNIQCPDVEISEIPLVASCTVDVSSQDNSTFVVNWLSDVQGGISNRFITWTGTDGLNSSSTSVSKIYTSGGTKEAKMRVVSGDQTKELTCLAVLPTTITPDQIFGSCSANPQGMDITWSALGTGGNGNFSYLWNTFNGTTSSSSNVTTHYNTAGEKTAYVTISNATSSIGLQCAAIATQVASTTSSCFIATAAFGTSMESEVQTLRDFRDEHLLSNSVGTIFVNTYYTVSPPIADFIHDHGTLRAITRGALKPIIATVNFIE
jgi:hypothetical protein